MGAKSQRAIAAERQLKLALFVAAKGPVSRHQIEQGLPEYAVAPQPGQDAHRAQETVRRRFERDKAELSAQGIELESCGDGLYRIAAPRAAEAGPFQGLEAGSPRAALLRVASTALLQDEACPQGRALRIALAKLSGPLEIPDTLAWAEEGSLACIAAPKPPRGSTRRKAATALERCKRLSFDYTDAAGRNSTRCVEPIGLYTSKGREYLAAWDLDRGAKRCFRIDRMGNASVSGNGRGKPDFEPHPFIAQEWQLLGFQMGQGPAQEALVRVSPSALWQARNICAGYGELLHDEIGRVSWRVSYSSARELAAWCVANGPGLIPVQPQEAAQAYAAILEEAQRWGSAGSSTPREPAEEDASAPTQDELAALLWDEETPQEAEPAQDELARFVEELVQRYLLPSSEDAPQAGPSAEPKLGEQDVMLALLCMLEEAGRVSLPQASQLLGVPEEAVYSALETLVFCYDAAGLRLELGEPGCGFAALEQPAGLHPRLCPAEERALASAAAGLTERSTATAIAAAFAQEQLPALEISYWKEGAAAPQLRVVEPQTLVEQQGHTYLQAWCRLAGGRRMFRFDRILSVRALPGQAPLRHSAQTAEEQGWQRARIALAAGTRVPTWPGVQLAKKQARSGDIGLSVPWYGGPWLPKQLASLGAQALRIQPSELAWATFSYAAELQKELEESE